MYFLLTGENDIINDNINDNINDFVLSSNENILARDGLFNLYDHIKTSPQEPYFPIKIFARKTDVQMNITSYPYNRFDDDRYYKYKYIRSVILVKDCQISSFTDSVFGVNKMIFGSRYYLGDPRTIKKFNINVDEEYIYNICAIGDVKFLEWWKNSGSPLKYNYYIVLLQASRYGNVNVLEWCKNSGLDFSYGSNDFWCIASESGHTNILEWLKNSELTLAYDTNQLLVLDRASRKGHVNVLEWWKNSGLSYNYSERALHDASWYGHVNVLEWWKNSGLHLKYTEYIFNVATSDINTHVIKINVIEWWLSSGLEIKTSDKMIKIILNYFNKVISQLNPVKNDNDT
jgi:hypothetical protein